VWNRNSACSSWPRIIQGLVPLCNKCFQTGRGFFLKGRQAPLPKCEVDSGEMRRLSKAPRTEKSGPQEAAATATIEHNVEHGNTHCNRESSHVRNKYQQLHQHTQAVANAELKIEFLSGVGCTSILVLDDDVIDELLKVNKHTSTAEGLTTTSSNSHSVQACPDGMSSSQEQAGSSSKRQRLDSIPVRYSSSYGTNGGQGRQPSNADNSERGPRVSQTVIKSPPSTEEEDVFFAVFSHHLAEATSEELQMLRRNATNSVSPV